MNGAEILNRAAIIQTYDRIASYIRCTPCMDVDSADFGVSGGVVNLKLELMQHSGSFKARGAFTNLLTRAIPTAGVAAASGGNHGVAVAYAASKLHVPAHIFVPTITSRTKLQRLGEYGAQVSINGERYADALAESEVWARQSGALVVHAFDQRETLLGQATLGLEWERQTPRLDTLLIAVGGGGLIGGIAGWFAGRTRIIGVEPEAAPTLYRALEAGHPVDTEAGGVAADSLAPKRVGELMFPIAQRFVNKVVLVSDEAILLAQRRLWETVRIAAEPGGVAALAALISGKYEPRPGERVGVLICGGNTDAVRFEHSRC